MCWVFSCAGWILDLIQKFITFFLTCVVMVVIGAFIAFGVILGIAYGYNVSLAEYYDQKPTNQTKMTFQDLTRQGGRRQGFEDDNTIVGDGKKQLNDEAEYDFINEIDNYDGHVPLAEKIGTDKSVMNRPLVPQRGDTYASWWNNVENELLFPISSPTTGGGRPLSKPKPDIINLMPSLRTVYKPDMSTITVTKTITENLKKLLRGSSGDLRKTTDYRDNLSKDDKKHETFLERKTTDPSSRRTNGRKSFKLIHRKTKPKVEAARTSALTTASSTSTAVGVRKTVDSREEYEYNELRAVPIPARVPARAFPTQLRRTWKDLFKSSTRKITKLSKNEKSDDEDFYKDRNTADIRKTVINNKLRFQQTTTSSGVDVSFRFVLEDPEINVMNSEENDNSDESYEY